jgi:hypothetical protein
VIEKMDMETGRWVPAGEVDGNTEKFRCDGLQPNKKYKFRVKAVSDLVSLINANDIIMV